MWQMLDRHAVDLIVLDLMLPDTDGLIPVSYTHLDVYKRQIQISGSCCNNLKKYTNP